MAYSGNLNNDRNTPSKSQMPLNTSQQPKKQVISKNDKDELKESKNILSDSDSLSSSEESGKLIF